MGTLGWTEADLKKAVEDPLRSGITYSPLWRVKSSVKQTLRAMDEQARANFLKELLPVVKTVIMSPAYHQEHAGYIKSHQGAVNHGIKAHTEAMKSADEAVATMQTIQRQVAAQMAVAYLKMPIEGAKMLYTQDLENWKQQAADKDNSDRAKFQSLVARAKQIEPMIASNPEEFKKQYSLLKSVEAGGSADEAAVLATNAEAGKQREQQAWNQYNLNSLLKKRLTEFVDVASTVDFAAQTTGEGRNRKFIKPEYEQKPSEWKILYRLGKAPTTTALDFALQWLKEL
jgi:hypothetical protein